MENKIDWLTLTIKPEKCFDEDDSIKAFGKTVKLLRNTFVLAELWDKMENKGKCRFYDYRLSYNDVNIKISEPARFSSQGFCIELSGNGLTFFCDYLRAYGYTLQKWCSAFRALCLRGYVTKCTRFDLAMDDKVFDGARPTLTMRKVLDSVYCDEVSVRARLLSDDCGDLATFKRNYKRCCGQGLWGTTVYFGNRKSDTYVRFYDKKIEQQQKGHTLPDNLTSWVRCEFEFHDSNAMGMFNAFCDYDADKFGIYACGVVHNHLKFINRISTNISRCPVKRWWKAFLNGCSKSFHLPNISPQRSAFAKSKRWLDSQLISTIVTFMQIMSPDAFVDYVVSVAEDMESNGKNPIKREIINNYIDGRKYYEKVNGFGQWNYTNDMPSNELQHQMSNQYVDYWQQRTEIYRNPDTYVYFGGQMGLYDDNKTDTSDML